MRDDWSQRAREISRARQRLVELHHTSPPMPSSSIQDVLSLESFRVGRRAYERNNTRPQGSRLQSGRTGARSQNDNAIFEDPLEHEDLLYILGTAISSQDDRLSRSPRNPPSLTSSRLLDMLGDRGTNSSSNNPYTSSQPGSSGPPAVRRSPRFSALSATMPTPPDEYLERTHERRMREVDRTVREAEVHRRRVVEFLAESVSPLPSYRHSLSSQGPELPIPTSSYSTLRHALGDNAEGERTRQEHRASDSDQVPALAIAPPLSPVSRESNIGSHAHSPWDVSDDLPYELPPGADAHEHMSDFARLPRRRGPFRARTAGEMAASGIDREPSPTRTNIHDTPPLPVYNDFAVSTLMEANARARSISLSGLRHRARPRSPSPPAPASPLPPRMVSTYGDYWGDQEEPSGPRYSPANRSYPPRRAEDNAMLQAFIDPPAPLRRPSPERAPFSNASRSTEDRVRPARYSNINLDAYREGPFRATLARSVALQNRRVISDNRSESLNPTYPYGWPRSIPAAGESLRNNLGGFDRRDASASTRRESRPDVPHDRLGTHSEVLDGHSEDELSNAWELEFFGPRTSALESRFDPPSVRATTPAAPPPLPMAPLLPPRVTPRGSLLSETRSSAVRDQTIGRPTLRHRTLLDREHASNSPWSDDPGTRTAAAAARLERVERHREMMHRVVTSRQAPIVAASPRPPTSMSRTAESSTDPSSTGTQLSMWTRRYNRHPLSTAYREGRAEDRQAPLNGRFARRGGLGQHYPPDMVWVDGPGRSAWSRRRNIGDYMRDEDFDVSYEGLLSLSSLLGDVKPRGTPADIIASLPKGTYGEWARPGTTEERCPICLDDYQPTDQCLRICDCSHWFHEGCLQQWLKGARTCPVCRGRVRKPPSEESSEPVAGPSGSNRRDRDRDREDDSDGEDGDDPRRRRRNPWMRPPWRHD
ncbi:hypothetical protein C8Q79DRAFT_1011899 [Trametes meyenii]|nr:hypothetical protein C8Q79DRAFT_1011899 [Trametes meyenii]